MEENKRPEDLNVCPLFYGGHCPMYDNDWERYGFSSLKEGRKANRDCCKVHEKDTEEFCKHFKI